MIGAQPHFGHLARWISLHRTITYIHGGYNNTYKSHEYNNINTRHPTTDANMKSTMTSILLSEAADQEPNPRLTTKKKELQHKEHRSHVKSSEPAPTNIVVVFVSHEDSTIP